MRTTRPYLLAVCLTLSGPLPAVSQLAQGITVHRSAESGNEVLLGNLREMPIMLFLPGHEWEMEKSFPDGDVLFSVTLRDTMRLQADLRRNVRTGGRFSYSSNISEDTWRPIQEDHWTPSDIKRVGVCLGIGNPTSPPNHQFVRVIVSSSGLAILFCAKDAKGPGSDEMVVVANWATFIKHRKNCCQSMRKLEEWERRFLLGSMSVSDQMENARALFLNIKPSPSRMGKETQKAILQYQESHGLPKSGVLDETTRLAMILSQP
jgi:hypothetical protein